MSYEASLWVRRPRCLMFAASLFALLSVTPLAAQHEDFSSFANAWTARYPTSKSLQNVITGSQSSCLLCHDSTSGGGSWNGYGWSLRTFMLQQKTIAEAIVLAEGIDSDSDPSQTTNVLEINADTQPGWTVGNNNTIYFRNGTTLRNQSPPANIGLLDPLIGPPDIDVTPLTIDFGSVTVNNTVTKQVTVRNVGVNSLTITGLTISGSTAMALNPANKVPPYTIAANASEIVSVDFRPAAPGPQAATLAIASDDPDEPTVNVSLSGTGVSQARPDIDVTPLKLDFGSVQFNATATRDVTIANVGVATLRITDLVLSGSPDVSLNAANKTPPFDIPPQGSEIVKVSLRPTKLGAHIANLAVKSNDPDETTVNVAITGSGVATGVPQITVTPPSLDFGVSGLNTKKTLKTTISNTGAGVLTVWSATLAWGKELGFSIHPLPVPFDLGPTASRDVFVDFTPPFRGYYSSGVEIISSDPDEPLTVVSLTGIGGDPQPDIAVTPSALDYGRVKAGRTKTLSVTVKNVGGANLTVSGLTVFGTSFTLNPGAPSLPRVLAPNATVVVPVDFKPTAAGNFTGKLTIASNDPDLPSLDVGLAGTAFVTEPDIDVTPTSLAFGQVGTGNQKTLSVTIHNLGDADLTVHRLTVRGDADFGLGANAPLPPFVVAPNGSRAVPVTFRPIIQGARAARLIIASDDPDESSLDVALAGTGAQAQPDIDVSPTSLSFGDTPIGTDKTLSVTISNLGDANLTVSGLSVTGRPHFALGASAPVPPFVVGPNGSRTVPVLFKPNSLGPLTGKLTIQSDDPDEPTVDVGLAGTGTPPQPDIDVSPLTLAFGQVNLHTTSTLNVAVGNVGAKVLTVTGLSVVTGPTFVLGPNAPSTPFQVAPNGSTNVPVSFQPTLAGPFTGTLTITSDDPDEPSVVVSLSGIGFQPARHPQAVTDCSNCHFNPTTKEPDLQGIHGRRCGSCHPNGFGSTILGRLGNWNKQCSACHNERVAETGFRPEPTKGHRCIVCHGQQMSTTKVADIHEEHVDKANCVVCHGFIPDVGTKIGSGNRQICVLCHGSTRSRAGIREIHEEHTKEGLSCLECHGGQRPPIDVKRGPKLGSSEVVCDICHSNRDPKGFDKHEDHIEKRLDCGSCHIDANLQDDRDPMPTLDDTRRAQVQRAGYGECRFCHGKKIPSGNVHRVHVAKMWQWCYNCHEGNDLRPIGKAPPVTKPSEACSLCHGSKRRYTASQPFDVHKQHVKKKSKNKCYSCHQAEPPLFDWPTSWDQRPSSFASRGKACQGSNGKTPRIGSGGPPLLGGSFDVTLRDASGSTPVILSIGLEPRSLDLTPFGMTDCLLLAKPLLLYPMSSTAEGTAAFRQPLPDDDKLLGKSLYYQWFVDDAAANKAGVITSDGARATLGRGQTPTGRMAKELIRPPGGGN